MTQLSKKEVDVRINVLNSITNTPHRNVEPLVPLHLDAENGDPLFYIKLGIWYTQHGTIKDHAKVFAAKIITSPFTEFRKVGEKLLTMMSLRETDMSVQIAEEHFKGNKSGPQRRIRKTVVKMINEMEELSQKDNGVRLLRNREIIKDLIIRYHVPIKYKQTAASLHFRVEGDAQPYNAFAALRTIKNDNLSEAHICTLIDKYRLPPTQVMGTLKELTPAIAAAMLKGMSSAETVNFMAMFERKGLTNIKEFTDAVEKKVTKGPKSATSSMRSMKAAKALNSSEGAKTLATITNDFVSTLPRIKKSVVLAIDKSYSMQEAITVGKELATILSAVVANPKENLNICVYNNVASEILISEKNEYTDFEARFRYIKANGTTALGSVIKYIDAKNIHPDVIIFIGDADESDTPLLKNALAVSENVNNTQLINLKVGNKVFDLDIPTDIIAAKGLEIENMKYDGDYYSLPNILKIVTKGGIKETIAEIEAIDIEKFINSSN